ncbi:MAG: hypothetical protein JRH08_00710 [Deltaproteobacteria bacterium]|nr:hypothetical protein [Deltaproteobacteria bacterium]MBW2124224.1 hypothetical protein [Deltaproteobacteria bacterium]
MIKATIKGLKTLDRNLKAKAAKANKALETAIKIEGYRLRRQLIKEIRQGAPGGRPFAPLSVIGARTKASNLRGARQIKEFGRVGLLNRPKKTPLARLATAIRYQVHKAPNFRMEVGWVGPKVSKSWKRIARMQQEGFMLDVTDEMRRMFRRLGASMSKRSKYRKYFFLRKGTARLRVPARPIIEPFWQVHEREARDNIRINFHRKLRGERI